MQILGIVFPVKGVRKGRKVVRKGRKVVRKGRKGRKGGKGREGKGEISGVFFLFFGLFISENSISISRF